jgi:hypothetical protein
MANIKVLNKNQIKVSSDIFFKITVNQNNDYRFFSFFSLQKKT